MSCDRGTSKIRWTIDRSVLASNSMCHVSPRFSLCLGGDFTEVPFRIIVYPPKGTRAFRKSPGQFRVQLKCEPELPEEVGRVSFSVAAGEDSLRGPFCHDFSSSAICSPPTDEGIFTVDAAETAALDICWDVACWKP
eukprot:gb/GFBE01016156.1/.p1 GENE.gb/GFBE01016156.1/~~gb/GFBE01016156.1/.p1  ORF type:complete len:137 (+),score=21.83 gb/GFBE01016156.1/:1-411(+)